MVKRENESDHRFIRYLISLPLGANVTSPEVLKKYSEVLKKISDDIKDSALEHIRLNIQDIMSDGTGISAMSLKLQSVLQRLKYDKMKVPSDLASVILSQSAVDSSVIIDICDIIEKPRKFEEFFKMCNALCMKRV